MLYGKFPSFKSAPKESIVKFNDSTSTKENKKEPKLNFYIENRGDFEYFTYGKFKETIAYDRSKFENIKEEECIAVSSDSYSIYPNGYILKKVDFVISDKSLIKRLNYCIEETKDSFIINPEILNLTSSEAFLENQREKDPICINFVLREKDPIRRKELLNLGKNIDIIERLIYQDLPIKDVPPNHPWYFDIIAASDFISFNVRDFLKIILSSKKHHYYVNVLKESGYSERCFKHLGFDCANKANTFPNHIPVPIKNQEEKIKEWLLTERERSIRFSYSRTGDEYLLPDDPMDDPERSPEIDFILEKSLKFEKELIFSKTKDFTYDRDELTQMSLNNPLDMGLLRQFFNLESNYSSFFRIRKWIGANWDKIKTNIDRIIEFSQILYSYFSLIPQNYFFEEAIQIFKFIPEIWIQYINICNPQKVSSVAYRAINSIPYCKELYLKAIEAVPNTKDKLTLIQLMEQKGIRMRTFIEEFDEE